MTLEKVEAKTVESDKETKKEEKKEFIQIVEKLPVQEVRTLEKDGVIIKFMTIAEYLTAQANPEDAE